MILKTLDEVIEYFNAQCNKMRHVYLTEDADARFADALHYLKMYRSDKLQWEADRKLWQEKGLEFEEAKQRLIEAAKGFQKAKAEIEEISSDYVALKQWWTEQQVNPPLTWDELKTMEGKPVWVVVDGKERWHIIMKVTNEHLILESGLPLHKCWMNHPDGWQAYRKERK